MERRSKGQRYISPHKNLLSLGFFFALGAMAMPNAALARQPIIAIFTIKAEGTRIKSSILDRLTAYLANQVTAKGAYQVVPRDQLLTKLREQKRISYKKCYEQSCQIQIGRELAASKSMATKIMRIGRRCIMTASIYNLKTSTQERAAAAKGKCDEDGMLKLIDDVIAKLSGVSPNPNPTPMPTPSPDPDNKIKFAHSVTIAWPPSCGQPEQCLVAARRLREQDQGLLLALYAHVNGKKRARWAVSKKAMSYIKRLMQGYIPRQTQLEEMLTKRCSRRQAGACFAMAMLKKVEKNDKDYVRFLRSSCRARSHAGCTELASLLSDGRHGVIKNEQRALRLYRRACDSGYLQGCSGMAVMYRYGRGTVQKNERMAIQLYQRACNRRLYQACQRLGYIYTWGSNKNYSRAVSIYRRACDGGHAASCSALASMYKYGRGVPKNEMKANAIYRKACKDGYIYGCTAIKDYATAFKMRQKRCDEGNLFACNALARAYKYGRGVTVNITKANSLYRRSCNLGNISACISIKDDARVTQLYRQGCQGGNKYNCNALGDRYRYGRGVTKNAYTAVSYYRKACDTGYAYACNNLGRMYRNGEGVPRNETRALAIFKRSCDAGNMTGCRYARLFHKITANYQKRCSSGNMWDCKSLARLYREGRDGVSKNLSKAISLYRRACFGGITSACIDLGKLYRKGEGHIGSNESTALSYFRRACSAGNRTACNYAVRCTSNQYRGLSGRCMTRSTYRRPYQYTGHSKTSSSYAKTGMTSSNTTPHALPRGLLLLVRPLCTHPNSARSPSQRVLQPQENGRLQ
jgi:TPR repeat protein